MSSSTESHPSQRIYVGGIDPDRLSVQEVLGRLERHLSETQRKLENIHLGSCYFQAEAPLDEARKLLNNVKWKGCKLKVEPARPHFLERLVLERQARNSNSISQEQKEGNHETSLKDGAAGQEAFEPSNNRNQQQQKRRNYKIRRSFGETVWNVDTKPYEVTDYANFLKLKKKLKRRQEAREADSPKQPKRSAETRRPQQNRAIHLRFEVPLEDEESERLSSENGDDDIVDSDQYVSSSSSDLSTGPKSSTPSKSKIIVDESDEGSSGSDDESDEDDEMHASQKLDSGDIPGVPKTNVVDNENTVNKIDKYVWSSDEDSSDDSKDQEDQNHSQKSLKEKWNPLDEFAMGVSAVDAVNTVDTSPSLEIKCGTVEELDFEKEQQTNFTILSQLFPDLEAKEQTSEKRQQPAKQAQLGWNATGQMLRFDPAKQSSQQFVVENAPQPSAPEEKIGVYDEEDQDKSNADGEKGDIVVKDSSDIPKVPRKEHLYQQSELESVFREAREEEAAVVIIEKPEDVNSHKGGFSFAFNLPDEAAPVPSNNSGTFSFSFDIPSHTSKDSPQKSRKLSAADVAEEQSVTCQSESGPSAKKRRCCFAFPNEDLDWFVQAFFEYDDGKRILEDLEGFQRDPSVRNAWEEERQSLTKDWKRKQKVVVSRKKQQSSKI